MKITSANIALCATVLISGHASAALDNNWAVTDILTERRSYFTVSSAGGVMAGTQSLRDSAPGGSPEIESERIGLGIGGVLFSAGSYFGESDVGVHQVDFSAGMLFGRKTWVINPTDPAPDQLELGYIAAPVTIGYNYNFKVAENTLLYLGAKGGALVMSESMEIKDSGIEDSVAASTTFVIGVTAGIKYQFSKSFGLELGYDYLKMGSPKFTHKFSSPSGNAEIESKLNNPDLHLVHLGASWRF